MHLLKTKAPAFLPTLFLISILGLSNCNQQEKTEQASNQAEPSKQEIPVVSVMPDTLVKTETIIKQQEVPAISNTKKEQESNKKITIEKKVIPESKPPVVNNTNPSTNTTTLPKQPTTVVTPEVVKPEPKPVDVPKPVVVVTTTPNQTDWVVPANYKNKINPYPADKANIELGKTLYGTHCKSCHGNKADGKGPKSATLDTEIRSFLSAGFKAQNAGEVFYKSIIGRKDMPKFDKKIPDEEEQWAIVNYIMNFKN